jgi:hypothetical protein
MPPNYPAKKSCYNTNIIVSEPSGCEADQFANGQCDDVNNNTECGWDGGDCSDPGNEETNGIFVYTIFQFVSIFQL